jgi:hypothetical protein
MNAGKTLFSQVMEFVPWKSFGRIIDRHRGDAGVRTLGSSDLFRIMAFAQLTWRESLRDIEACMAANQAKLFHMGLKSPPARSTLADALNRRDWRIYPGLAQRLIARARTLYAQESSLLELDASVYALDSTTIDLCLSLFDWAPFRSNADMVRRRHVRADRHRQKGVATRCLALHLSTDPVGLYLRENRDFMRLRPGSVSVRSTHIR